MNPIDYCNNPTVNLITHRYYEICKKDNINFTISIKNANIDFMKEHEITDLLDNLLENTIESALITNDKFIDFSICTRNSNFVIIKISNSCNKKPKYINGIFALLIAFGTKNTKAKFKKVICILLCVLNIICVAMTGMFEYNSSMNEFFNRFEKINSSTDIFVYCDNSFGILSYYYPESTHICTCSEPWFAAFDNVECLDINELSDRIQSNDTVWFVKNELTKTPEYIKNDFELELVDSFKCDFNTFNVYIAKK